jgi:hypothetical protein
MLGCPGSGPEPPTDAISVDDNPVQAEPTDDSAPPPAAYDAALSYLGREGWANHSTERYRFDVAPFRSDGERADAERLHPSHAEVLAGRSDAVPSVQTVGTYEKQLDDEVVAGVELAVQRGLAPTLAPKRTILTEALAWLVAHRGSAADEAIAVVAAALEEGGAGPRCRPTSRPRSPP